MKIPIKFSKREESPLPHTCTCNTRDSAATETTATNSQKPCSNIKIKKSSGSGPSKISILCYYISVIFTVLGVIVVIHSAINVKEAHKASVLGLGLCMFTSGIAFLIISNVVTNKEHERIVNYLDRKVDELRIRPNHPDTTFLVEDMN